AAEIVKPGEKANPFGKRKKPATSAKAPEKAPTQGPYIIANKMVGIKLNPTLTNWVSTAKKRVNTTFKAIIKPMTAMSLAMNMDTDFLFSMNRNSFIEPLHDFSYAANARTKPQ